MWQNYDGTESKILSDIETIRKFDGATYIDPDSNPPTPIQLSIYLQDDDETNHLYENGVRGGVLNYQLIKNDLWLLYTYASPQRLSDSDIEALIEFTIGQCTDGAGPAFSGELEESHDGVSPLSEPNEFHVTQEP